MVEYNFVVQGRDIVAGESNYHIFIPMDTGKVEVVFSSGAVTDFERLYRQDIRSVSQFKLRTVISDSSVPTNRIGRVESVDDIVY